MPASRPRPPLDGDRATRAAPAALTSSSGAADAAPDPAAQVAAPAVTRVGFAPIVRVDSPQREIELCATSEAVDSYGTIFDYAASKDAFQRWIGTRWNILAHPIAPSGRVSRSSTPECDCRQSAQRPTLVGSSILPSRFCKL